MAKYGYILEEMEGYSDAFIFDKMKQFGCERIFVEKAYDGFRRVAWKELKKVMQFGDSLVYPRFTHIATDGIMFYETKRFCSEHHILRFVFENFKSEAPIVKDYDFAIYECGIRFITDNQTRKALAMSHLRERCLEQFPNKKPRVLEKIHAARCLQFDIAENELAFMTKYKGTEEIKRLKTWLADGYKEDLTPDEREVFDSEFYGNKVNSSYWLNRT